MTGGVLLAAYALAAGFGAPAAPPGLGAAIAPDRHRTVDHVGCIMAGRHHAGRAHPDGAAGPPAASGRAAGNLVGLPGGTTAAVAGLLLTAAVVPASWHLARGLARARRGHRAHAAFLTAAGRRDQALDAVILDDDPPTAYCLPHGRHRVVISAGTLSRLSPGQVQAVLAHERARLRGHHHLLATTAALARAFPPVPLLARAPAELAVGPA